jgi:hypothetical protein
MRAAAAEGSHALSSFDGAQDDPEPVEGSLACAQKRRSPPTFAPCRRKVALRLAGRPLARAAGAVLALSALVTAVGSAQAGVPGARSLRAGVESGAAPSGATRDTTLRSVCVEPGQKSLAGAKISLDEIPTARELPSSPSPGACRMSTTASQDARTTIDPARASSGGTIASRRGPERAEKRRVKRRK